MPYSGPRLRTSDGNANGIGRRVAARRSALNLTQDEFCGQLASQTGGRWAPRWADISRLENGVRVVTDVEVRALAETLDCSAAWLLLGEELLPDRKKFGGEGGGDIG